MCKFFSFVGDGYGNYKYAGWDTRKRLLKEESDDSPDSHTWLLRDVPVELQDRWSRYEYNPLTGKFTVDQGVDGHNHDQAEKWVKARDWKPIVEPLIIKNIVNPFDVTPPKRIAKKHIDFLRKWASVRDSVRAYCSSFFDIKYNYDFSPCAKLWKMGLVPSFDGKVWRLYGGKDAKVLWEGKI